VVAGQVMSTVYVVVGVVRAVVAGKSYSGAAATVTARAEVGTPSPIELTA